MNSRASTLAGRGVDSRWLHGFPKAANAFHQQFLTQRTTGLPKQEPLRGSLAAMASHIMESPKSIKEELANLLPWAVFIMGLHTLMDNKAIYSTQCESLFKPSSVGSRTFLALPAKK